MEINQKAEKMNIKIDVQQYGIQPNNTITIFRDVNTIGYVFINTGNTPVNINNYVLFPGATWTTLQPGLIDKTYYKAYFDKTNGVYTSCGNNLSSLTAVIYQSI